MPTINASDRRMLRAAMLAARQGDRRHARSLLAEYTQENPGDPLGWLWRAAVAHTPELALLWLDQLLERDPDHEAGKRARHFVRLQAGVAASQTGDRAMARVRFLEATRSDPADFVAWLELAHHAKSPAEERSALETAVRLRPDHETARRVLAELADDISEKAADPDRLIEIFDDDAPESVPLSVLARQLPSKESRVESGLHRPMGSALTDSRGLQGRQPEPAPTAPRGKSTPVLGQGNPAHHATVLIVAEDSDDRQTLRAELEKRNIRGVPVPAAPQALIALRDLGLPNLIVIDVDLPEIDSFKLCRYLRQSPELAKVPVVLTSRQVGLYLRTRAYFAGAKGTLPKPTPIAVLEQLLACHCPAPKKAGGKP